MTKFNQPIRLPSKCMAIWGVLAALPFIYPAALQAQEPDLSQAPRIPARTEISVPVEASFNFEAANGEASSVGSQPILPLRWHHIPLAADAPDGGDDDLAKKAQNPIASMISLPIDTSIDFGADNGTAVVSNIQPVIPTNLGEWNLVSRFILPVAYVEGAIGGTAAIPEVPKLPSDEVFGLGDLNYTGFLSPAKAGSVIWGVGPSVMFPTATDPLLGSEKWSAGPSLVVLTQPKPWSLGILYRHLWSFAGASDRSSVNQSLIQTFINYNLDNGWYLMTDPIILANWGAPSSDRWTVPIGGGIGRIFKIGDQPVNARLRAYYNLEKPQGAPEWSVNFSVAFLFPK